MTSTYAIIPAAGQGKRFGSVKQLQTLAGKPVLLHTLAAFEACQTVSGIFVAVPEPEVEGVQDLIRKNSLSKVLQVVSGGKERQDSVKKAFEVLPSCDVVLVHDGVRPFVASDVIERAIAAAKEWGACAVGLPVRETTKEVDGDGRVVKTVDRSRLWSIQTPQAFRYDLLKEAFRRAEADGFYGTDEAMLVERIGSKVKVVEGSPYNMKITLPEDLEIAEAILNIRRP